MSNHRIGFNPNLPLVAGTEFTAGELQVKVGDAVDWKKLGITEQVAFDWWRSGMVSHPHDEQLAVGPADEPAEDVTVGEVIADVLAGDAVTADNAESAEASDTKHRAPKKPAKKH